MKKRIFYILFATSCIGFTSICSEKLHTQWNGNIQINAEQLDQTSKTDIPFRLSGTNKYQGEHTVIYSEKAGREYLQSHKKEIFLSEKVSDLEIWGYV